MIKKTALIMVDLQNDFCKGGSLAVPGGDEVIPLANNLQAFFDIVVATQDWHPKNHMSFASNHAKQVGEVIDIEGISQVLWPDHCVQHSKGAEFHPNLKTNNIHKIVHKGVEKKVDSYSAFYDNAHLRSTGLGEYLRDEQVEDVYIMGLATDYCVKFSSLDAKQLGFNVHLIEDACRGVELKHGDIGRAIQEMRSAGVNIIQSSDILKSAASQS